MRGSFEGLSRSITQGIIQILPCTICVESVYLWEGVTSKLMKKNADYKEYLSERCSICLLKRISMVRTYAPSNQKKQMDVDRSCS